MARQSTRIRRTVETDRQPVVLPHHVHIEIHQPLAADTPTRRADSMRRMARRATSPGIDVIRMIVEARILHDLVRQIMALAA
jgi:hypothetical protein